MTDKDEKMLKDERLKTLCEAVRGGVTVCDVGTDHAYVPVELILSGKTPECIITDISAPSLEKGVNNAKMAGCGEKITAYCTSGTLGVAFDGETDIVIAGMGGELIAQIIEQDRRLKSPSFRFVLQPMSKAEELRCYLAENGFEMTDEVKIESGGRIYAVISCKYSGTPYSLTEREQLLGSFERKGDPLEKGYSDRVLSALKIRLKGLESAENRNEAEILCIKAQINAVSN